MKAMMSYMDQIAHQGKRAVIKNRTGGQNGFDERNYLKGGGGSTRPRKGGVDVHTFARM